MTVLNWIPAVASGGLAVAHERALGRRPIDQRAAARLAEPAERLAAALAAVAPAEPFYRHVLPRREACEAAALPGLVGDALRAATGEPAPAPAVARVAAEVAAFEAAFASAYRVTTDELALRRRPLHEQWEALGPGLIAAISRHAPAVERVPRADVLLLQPVFGGGGRAFPAAVTVTIEAVLVNPHPELPEVARLAWLVAQLGAPRHQIGGTGHDGEPAGMGLLLPALAAAEELELVRNDQRTFDVALRAWGLSPVEPQ